MSNTFGRLSCRSHNYLAVPEPFDRALLWKPISMIFYSLISRKWTSLFHSLKFIIPQSSLAFAAVTAVFHLEVKGISLLRTHLSLLDAQPAPMSPCLDPSFTILLDFSSDFPARNSNSLLLSKANQYIVAERLTKWFVKPRHWKIIGHPFKAVQLSSGTSPKCQSERTIPFM